MCFLKCFIRLCSVLFSKVLSLGVWMLGERKCVKCGADLSDEDVMKIILEDGSCEVFPFSTCPKCFQKELGEKSIR
jgi:predicted nucleic-acid-binding Zn-ribbon protein